MVSPSRRRDAVRYLVARHPVSERRACNLLGQHRSTQRYVSAPPELEQRLFKRPLVNVNHVTTVVGVTFPTANRLVARFEELGILREVTGQRRSRLFRYDAYLALFDDHAPASDAAPPEVTDADNPGADAS